MDKVVVVGLGASILLFAITYEYTKLKKGHTNNDNEVLLIVAEFGAILLLFLATQEYTKLKGVTKVHSWH
jgi:Kef-type K+ transport system membrane component KefB